MRSLAMLAAAGITLVVIVLLPAMPSYGYSTGGMAPDANGVVSVVVPVTSDNCPGVTLQTTVNVNVNSGSLTVATGTPWVNPVVTSTNSTTNTATGEQSGTATLSGGATGVTANGPAGSATGIATAFVIAQGQANDKTSADACVTLRWDDENDCDFTVKVCVNWSSTSPPTATVTVSDGHG